eukprot:gene11156-3214_t
MGTERPNSLRLRQRASLVSARGRQLASMIIQNKQTIDAFSEHRAYFTYWNLFLQLICLVVVMAIFDPAPLDYKTKEEHAQVYRADGIPISATKNVTGNIFYGPSNKVIIGLGGAYGPCMRRDEAVNLYIEEQRTTNSEFGCCVRPSGDYCFSSSEETCNALAGQRFYNNTICHGQHCCNSGTWPDCEKIPEENLSPSPEDDVCRCEITARPCCFGILGECAIKTKSECDFLDGFYQEDAVACEESIGWLRTGLIYTTSSVGGYTVATIISPYQVKGGPSPGVYGILACLYILLFESWQHVVHPKREVLKLIVITFIALLFGLLPFVDNFSQVAGFLFGIASAFAFLPWQSYTSKSFYRARKRIATFLGLVMCVSMGTEQTAPAVGDLIAMISSPTFVKMLISAWNQNILKIENNF